MASAKQRGSKVLYVAGAAREFPQDVQDWLSHTPHRPAACPHVYDALAQLVGGRRPAAMIVSLEALDWDELEFFDLATKLSRDTRIFVAGLEHQQAKLEAAIARGAEVFESAVIDELLEGLSTPAPPGSQSLLAGTLRPQMPPAPAMPKVVPPEPLDVHQRPVIEPQPDEDPQDLDEETAPPVRLVSSTEFEETEAPVPFPWAPAANRPQRTPPPAGPEQPGEPPANPRSKSAQPVMLTADELAALLGRKVPTKEGKAQEGHG